MSRRDCSRGEPRDLTKAGQDQGECELGGALLVTQSMPVAQGRVRRHGLEHLVDAAAQALDDRDPREAADQRDAGRVAHVGKAVEGDLVQRSRFAAPYLSTARRGAAAPRSRRPRPPQAAAASCPPFPYRARARHGSPLSPGLLIRLVGHQAERIGPDFPAPSTRRVHHGMTMTALGRYRQPTNPGSRFAREQGHAHGRDGAGDGQL